MNRHWVASCTVNALLVGDPNCPFCATVYISDCCWRGVYLFCADIAFAQHDHCGAVFDRWTNRP